MHLRSLALTCALVVAGVGSAACQAPRDSIDVLLVGNSYIYFNNLPALIRGVSDALDGPVVRVVGHTRGGQTLRGHLDDGQVAELLTEGPDDGQWEWVILQEQSTLGAPYADDEAGTLVAPDGFHAAARELVALAREVDARPGFYMTWAKEAFPDQAPVISAAYRDIAREAAASVAPVGDAWTAALADIPDVDLFLDDGSHPHPTGSYLAALVIYATVTGRSPMGAPHELRGAPWNFAEVVESEQPTVLVSLPAALAEALQRIAADAVPSAPSGGLEPDDDR